MMDTLSASDGLDRCSRHVMPARPLRVSLLPRYGVLLGLSGDSTQARMGQERAHSDSST